MWCEDKYGGHTWGKWYRQELNGEKFRRRDCLRCTGYEIRGK